MDAAGGAAFAGTVGPPGVAQHPQPFEQAGGVMFGAGAVHTAAGTGEHFDENRLSFRHSFEAAERQFQVVESGQRRVVDFGIGGLEPDGVVHAAFDRILRPLLGCFGHEPVGGIGGQPFGMDRGFPEHLAQFGVGDREIQQLWIAVRLIFFADAGADENHRMPSPYRSRSTGRAPSAANRPA